mmetsp:Transcript_118310/g.241825  ORF Transcript_118310/g.241825 Transcript_118310/m.241825 type:complete len:214 (+) Transcript_118310:99-740(+)
MARQKSSISSIVLNPRVFTCMHATGVLYTAYIARACAAFREGQPPFRTDRRLPPSRASRWTTPSWLPKRRPAPIPSPRRCFPAARPPGSPPAPRRGPPRGPPPHPARCPPRACRRWSRSRQRPGRLLRRPAPPPPRGHPCRCLAPTGRGFRRRPRAPWRSSGRGSRPPRSHRRPAPGGCRWRSGGGRGLPRGRRPRRPRRSSRRPAQRWSCRP